MAKLNVAQLLEQVVKMGASDLHLSMGVSPVVRVNTVLSPLSDFPPLTTEDIEFFLSQILNQEQKDILDVNKELDLSVALGKKVRFRVNVFFQKGYPSVAMRTIPLVVPSLETLNLPPVVNSIADLKHGLVLVVGPTGHGKSTTIAGMLDRINSTRAEHILTIEDPIEYIFTNKKSLIEQREMYLDTHSWEVALKAVLRQDPNVVFIGEMRDHDSMQAALTIAETGHLVFTTLHTNSAAQTIDRIIDSFPEGQQGQVRIQLSQILEAVISQRLIPSTSKGLVPAIEVLIVNTAVSNMIREGKTHQIDNVINTGASLGMVALNSSLADLINAGEIDLNEALKMSLHTDELRNLVGSKK
ncbi:type IV pilus twitching motility protein PilT [candidate division WWE3 bacterium]|jgi:twitching motility protein PilT|nr:type IV pilus twitching motility protein PilT [candidate division WWE3 bacterium]MBT7350674.1 type IV pilus twitching motility protein PilT [candidate division WWE3 bacterium]